MTLRGVNTLGSTLTTSRLLGVIRGIMHESREGSSAFVFDMMEPERPKVDRSILELAKSHKFHAADFVIRTDGVCRLNPAMARCVAEIVWDNRNC